MWLCNGCRGGAKAGRSGRNRGSWGPQYQSADTGMSGSTTPHGERRYINYDM